MEKLAFLDFKNRMTIVTDGVQASFFKMIESTINVQHLICTDDSKISKLDTATRFSEEKLSGRAPVDRRRLIDMLTAMDDEYVEISIFNNVREDYGNSHAVSVSGRERAELVMSVIVKQDFWRPFEKHSEA